MNQKPLVSVCMITYNHADFLVRAISGVLKQKTNFHFELIIANDASTDHSDTLIKSLISNKTENLDVVYYNHDKNLGMLPNFYFALNKCAGKYVAICEGDDYWINQNKLQLQVDFLEKNKDVVLLGHNAKINLNNIEEHIKVRNFEEKRSNFSTKDFIEKNPFVTSMTIFKNQDFTDINKIFDNFTVGDWPLFTLLSFKGKCLFDSESMGFYRKHENSVTSKNRLAYKPFKSEMINRMRHAIFWNNYSDNAFEDRMEKVLEHRSRTLVNQSLRNLDLATAIKFSKFIKASSLSNLRSRLILRVLKLLSFIAPDSSLKFKSL